MRRVHAPTSKGVGDGKVVYFLWGYGDASAEAEACASEVSALTEHGYAVVSDTAPGRRALREALYGQDPELEGSVTVALAWSGAADLDGSLQLFTGQWVSPGDVDPAYVTHELEWVSFTHCRTSKHASLWEERLGEHVTVRVEGKPSGVVAALVRAALLPGGEGSEAVAGGGDWEDVGGEGEERVFAADPEEDAYWGELFALLAPQRARAIEEGLGMSTRQYVWRLGELLASAAVYQLQGKVDLAVERHTAAASAASLLTSGVPALFSGSGEPGQAIAYLRDVVPRSSLGRGILRLGPDHDALLQISLQLLMLALSAEASDPIRRRLAALSPETKLSPELWARVLGYSGQDLFTKAHQEVFDELASERKPRHTTRAMAFGVGRRLALAARMDTKQDPSGVQMLVSCNDMAELLKVELPRKLPRQGRFPELAKEIGRKHGPDHASLFRLATQLIALRESYDPMSPETVYRLMKRLTTARKRASLPGKLFKPLAKIKRCTANRSQGYDLVDETLQEISEHLLLELDGSGG